MVLFDAQSLQALIQWGGIALLFCIIFAETGLFIGFFLPGDSLLFTAGLIAAAGYFNIWALIGALIVAAILGDTVGYWSGRHIGRRLFAKKDGKFFRHEYVQKAEKFYEKHGGKTIILARFIPVIRTFAPIVAGVGRMEYKRFLSFNVFGGIFWVTLMCGSAYFLVQVVPGIKNYLNVIIGLIILTSLIPVAHEYWTSRKATA